VSFTLAFLFFQYNFSASLSFHFPVPWSFSLLHLSLGSFPLCTLFSFLLSFIFSRPSRLIFYISLFFSFCSPAFSKKIFFSFDPDCFVSIFGLNKILLRECFPLFNHEFHTYLWGFSPIYQLSNHGCLILILLVLQNGSENGEDSTAYMFYYHLPEI